MEALFKVHCNDKPVLPKSLAGLMEFVKAYLNVCHERGLDGEKYNKDRITPLMSSKFHAPVTIMMNLVHDSPFKNLGVKKLEQGMAQFLLNQARRGQAESLEDDDDDDESRPPRPPNAPPAAATTMDPNVAAALSSSAATAKSLADSLTQESAVRKNDVSRIDGQISQVLSAIGSETAARQQDVARIRRCASALGSETAARQQDVARIDGQISQVLSAIGSETAARKHDVGRLDGRIDNEEQARKDDVARIDGQLSQAAQETAARKQDVARIDGNIDTVKDDLEQLKLTVSTLQKAERPEQQQHDLSGIQHLNFAEQKPAARSTPVKKPTKKPATSTKKPPALDHRNKEFWKFKPHYITEKHRYCITCQNTILGETPGRCSRHNKTLSDADLL